MYRPVTFHQVLFEYEAWMVLQIVIVQGDRDRKSLQHRVHLNFRKNVVNFAFISTYIIITNERKSQSNLFQIILCCKECVRIEISKICNSDTNVGHQLSYMQLGFMEV